MTKNFEMLLHYKFKKEHNEILENIKKIEKNIENKNYDNSIFLNGRTILEIMLHNIFKTNEKDGLSMQINEACQKYEVPSKVKNAFYFIKQKGDESSHRIKNVDKPYIIEYDLFISIELLKNLFIALKFCLIMDNSFENMKDEENLKNNFNFNSNIYLSKKIFKNQEDKNFYIDKNDMDSQTKGLFQLLTTNYKFFIPTYQREYS
jgi:L-rhamnose mutarotase